MSKSLSLPEPQFPHVRVWGAELFWEWALCIIQGVSPGWPRRKDCVLQSQGNVAAPSLPEGTTHSSHVPSELSALWPLHPMFLPQMVWLVHGLPSQNESSRAAEAMPALTRENIRHYCGHLVNIIEWRNEPVPKCTLSVSAWIPLDDDTRLDLPSSNGQDQTA